MSAKILIVEDNDSIRTILRMTLELGQYQVIEACDGQEGCERLRENRDCALVITDLAMPVMDGFQMIDCIRNDLGLGDLPILILTAEKGASVTQQKGPVRLIYKPFQPLELLDTVRKALQPPSQ